MKEIPHIEVSSDKFRSRMANYINEVIHGGKEVHITRRGKPKVKLVIIESPEDHKTQ